MPMLAPSPPPRDRRSRRRRRVVVVVVVVDLRDGGCGRRDAPASSSSTGPLDAPAEDGAMTMRGRDRAIETEARTHVRSIHRRESMTSRRRAACWYRDLRLH